jgi:hypothetical protein
MSDHTITMTPEAVENLRKIARDATSAFEAYGPCKETGDAMASALHTIAQVIGLGGRITAGDESMPLQGYNDFIAYGVARWDEKVPQSYRESVQQLFDEDAEAKAEAVIEDNVARGYAPLCRTYGVHS